MTHNSASHQHAETVHSHWWWRPGWRIGRRHYTWHLTFDGQTQLHRLVSAYQAQLAHLSGLDFVPLEWLHLTMQGVGFTDEVPEEDIDQITAAAQQRLDELSSPVQLAFGPAVVRPEAIALPPSPTDAVHAIRTATREAIADVWGSQHVPGPAEGFDPHVSLAYIDTDGASAPFIEAIEKATPQPATIELREASLITLDRDDRMYKWQTRAHTSFGDSGTPTHPADETGMSAT